MKRALIIEKMPCHQEIIPSWVWALSRLGYQVDVLAKAPPHRNIEKVMREVMNLTDFRVLSKASLKDYDVIVNNSLYPNADVPHLVQGKRTLSVLHTLPEQLLDFKDFRGLRNDDHRILALGPHMNSTLSNGLHAFRSVLTAPIFFGDPPFIHKNRRRFLVQGTMERFRRNYGCLAMLINKFALTHPFDVMLMGDGGEGVVAWLSPQIQSFHRGRLEAVLSTGYERFISEIRNAGWVLPCVDNTYKHGYFERKITSSVMMAIGNCTPLLLHQTLADIYGLVDGLNCLTYWSQSSLQGAFQKALDMEEDDYYVLIAQVRKVRLAWLDQLQQGFEKALEKN